MFDNAHRLYKTVGSAKVPVVSLYIFSIVRCKKREKENDAKRKTKSRKKNVKLRKSEKPDVCTFSARCTPILEREFILVCTLVVGCRK